MTSNLVSLSPELADKAHGLICEIVGAWNVGSIVTHEVRGAVRQWLVDVADFAQRPVPETRDEPHCDHEKLLSVNADGFCLICGENVLAESGGTTFGWLLEMTEFSKRPIYFSPGWNGVEWHWITTDPNIAVRFSRKEDAERLMNLFPRLVVAILTEEKWRAVQHGFMGSPVKTGASRCNHPPEARDLTFCRICGATVS